MTADGEVTVGRLGRRVADGVDYAQLLQGPALLEDGKLGAGAVGGDGLPAAGAAQTAEGDLLLATAPDGDRRGLCASFAPTATPSSGPTA